MSETSETTPTDQNAFDQDGLDEDDLSITWVEGVHDLVLDSVVGVVEAGAGSKIGITVTVNGQTITGDLVSRSSWLERLAEQAEGTGLESLMQQLRDSFSSFSTDDPHFLHIIDGHLAGGGGVTEGFGGSWRCKIGDVGAWCFGQMSRV